MSELNRIMVLKGGSTAIHRMGDIGRKEDSYIRVYDETYTHYIGSFEEGYGFIDVLYRREDVRQLNEEEVNDLNGKWYSISGTPIGRIYIDNEGNVMQGKSVAIKGVIRRVLDNNGFTKHQNFDNLIVNFDRNIQIGKSLMLFTDEGTITTSKVLQVENEDDMCCIYTKNSIYFIQIIKAKECNI